MQENIGPPPYQMNLSAAQYRVWSISSGDRSTRFRVSFTPRALQGSREEAMTHGVGLRGVLLAAAVSEEARARAFTSRQEGQQDRKEYGIENVMQAHRWPC
jgi:hypothetical protein